MGDHNFGSNPYMNNMMGNGRSDEDSLRGLQEEISGLDTEFDEIKKLQDMTEDAITHEDISGYHPEANIPNSSLDPMQEDSARRSVYVGNVDYSTTPKDLQEHFKSCGQINRITIMVDKWTGHPKGFAYLEFSNEDAMKNALLFSDTLFKDRQIKVIQKRKNIPGYTKIRGVRGRPPMRGYRPRIRGFYRPPHRGRGLYMRGYGRYF